jgi:acyl-CoA dehydrogenase
MAKLQLVQGHLADMPQDIDAAALLVYIAACAKDNGAARIDRDAAMAKLYATEAPQRVIDTGVHAMLATALALDPGGDSLWRAQSA